MDGETGSGRPPRSTGVSAPSHRQERNAGNSSGSPGGDESAPGEPGGTGGLDQGIPPKRRHCRRRPRYRPYLQAPRTVSTYLLVSFFLFAICCMIVPVSQVFFIFCICHCQFPFPAVD